MDGQAGAEIEITPAMIEAGYRVLCASGVAEEPLPSDRLVVEEMYRAMASVARGQFGAQGG